jgi:hypothetical protein
MAHKDPTSAIEVLWREHCSARFPDGLAGQEIAGICVALLDTLAAGCIQSFLDSGRKLDDEKLAVLDSCGRDLAAVVPSLTGEARAYFIRLEKLSSMTLDAVRNAPPRTKS